MKMPRTPPTATSHPEAPPMCRQLLLALCLILLIACAARADEPIFAPESPLKVVAENGAGGEGPAWDPKLGVLSSGNGHINQLDRDGKSRIFRNGAGTNGLLFDARGRLLAC